MKVIVFLFKETGSIVDKWPGETSKKKRTIEKKVNINGIKMTEAEVRDKRFPFKDVFYFIPVNNCNEIEETMFKIGVSPENVVILTKTRDPFFKDNNKKKKKKRYDYCHYGWIFFVNGIKEKDINEFISEFSIIGTNERINLVRKKTAKEEIKKAIRRLSKSDFSK